MNLRDWAAQQTGQPGAEEEVSPPVPPGMEDITVDDLLADPDLPDAMREWLTQYKIEGVEWAEENNPPGFVTDEGCWAKAESAAAEAADYYAFANWWYHEHCM